MNDANFNDDDSKKDVAEATSDDDVVTATSTDQQVVPPAPPVPPAPVTAPPLPTVAGQTVTSASPPAGISPELKGHLLRGLSTVSIALGGAFMSGLILALVLVGVAQNGIGSLGLPIPAEVLTGLGNFLLLAVTLAGAVLGGEVTLAFSGGTGIGGGAVGGSLWMFPLTLTLATLVLTLWWSIRQERVAPLRSFRNRLIFSAAVGLGTGLFLLVITLIFSLRFVPGANAEFIVTSGGYRVVLFGTILIGGVVLIGRLLGARAAAQENWVGVLRRGVAQLPRALREWLLYTSALSVLFGAIAVIGAVILLWDTLGAGAVAVALIGALNFAGLPLALGHLGGITAQAGFGSFGDAQLVTVVNANSGWFWLFVGIAVVFSVLAALWLGVRRARTAGIVWADSWKFPVAVFAGWVIFGLLFFGVSVSATGSTGVFGGSGTAGIALAMWTPAVFLLWAAAIEIGAQTLPAVLYSISPRALGALAGGSATATWLNGPGVVTNGESAVGSPPAAASPVPVGVGGGHEFVAASTGQTDGNAPVPQDNEIAGVPAATSVPAPPKPLSPAGKKKVIWAGIGVGGLAVLVVAGAVTVSIVNGLRTPNAVAESYLSFIADGNASAANALVDPNVSTVARTHLTDEVLQSATERISEISVDSSASPDGGEYAHLDVSFKLDGVTQHGQLTARKGDTEWLFFDTWVLDSPLVASVTIDVQGPGDASIGGVPVDADSEDSNYRQASPVLYPAVYELQSADESLFEIESSTLLVGAEPQQSAQIRFVATPELIDTAQAQVNALLDECAAQTSSDPDGCPLNAYVYPSDTPVTWQIVTYPAVEIADSGDQFRAEDGEATASYTRELFGTSEQRTEEDSISFSGSIEFTDGEVTVVYDPDQW